MAASREILVEGTNDAYFIQTFLSEHYGIKNIVIKKQRAESNDIYANDCDGISKLLPEIKLKLKDPNIKRLAIIVDADTDAKSRYQSLRHLLIDIGIDPSYISSDHMPQTGLYATIDMPDRDVAIGIWIMPNNKIPGNTEDFFELLVSEDDFLFSHAKQVVASLPEKRFGVAISKANFYTWKAWQEEPDAAIGTVVKKKWLRPDAPTAQLFVAWLKKTLGIT